MGTLEPGESGSSNSTRNDRLKCSQCRKDLLKTAFPLRILTLTHYSICAEHEWYWTDKKQLVWTPGDIASLDDMCADLDARLAGTGDPDERPGLVWVTEGDDDDRDNIASRLAATSGWDTKFIKARKSRATLSEPAPPAWHYTFEPPSNRPSLASLPVLRLTFTHNSEMQKWSIAVRTDPPTDPGEPWRYGVLSAPPPPRPAKKPSRRGKRKTRSPTPPLASAKWKKAIKRVRPPDDGREILVGGTPFDTDPNGALGQQAATRPPVSRETTPPPAPPPQAPFSADTINLMQVIQATLSLQPDEQPLAKRRRSGSPGLATTPRRVASSSTSTHHVPLNYLRPLSTLPPASPSDTFRETATSNAYNDPSLSLSYTRSPQRSNNPFEHPSWAAPPPNLHSHQAPLTLFQLLDSPFLSPPTLLPHPRFEPSRLSRHPTTAAAFDPVAAADEADDDLNSSDLESVISSASGSSDGESSDEEGDDGTEFINDEDEEETGWEDDDVSSEEGESEEEEDGEESEEGEGDWLEGFVKGQLVGGFREDEPVREGGAARAKEPSSEAGDELEVDELESPGR
ncbi:hypothetical protein RQP46_011439 [Phenoliferia psychrophenolica]